MSPTSTLKRQTAILAHVPVDHFDIIDGQREGKWTVTTARLYAAQQFRSDTDMDLPYVVAEFTLKTAASNQTFRRNLKVTSIYHFFGGDFSFTGIYGDQVVKGEYNVVHRKGHFELGE